MVRLEVIPIKGFDFQDGVSHQYREGSKINPLFRLMKREMSQSIDGGRILKQDFVQK